MRQRKLAKISATSLLITLLFSALFIDIVQAQSGDSDSSNQSNTQVSNPDYTQDCNSTVNIAVVLDASGSINNGGGVQDIRNGIKSLIDEIANNAPGTNVGIVEFGWSADTPIPFTPVNSVTVTNVFDPYIDVDGDSTALVKYYDNRHDIWTNWEAAMIQVNNNLSDANAVIFITDGNPNKYVDDDGNLQPSDYNTLADAATGVAETVPWTDLIKSRGTHIYGFGINNGVDPTNFRPITEDSADFEIYNNTSGNAGTADYAFVQQFSNFSSQLSFLINDICQLGSNPNLILVKRITAINSGQGLPNEQDFSNYYVDVTTGSNATDDNDSKWPGIPTSPNEGVSQISDYLSGETEGVTIVPDDEIEYTIYFLSNGDNTAQTVLVCDLIPENTEFVTNAFSNEPAASGGSSGAERGILWQYDGVTESFTNADDGDAGYYFSPGVEPSTIFPGVQCDIPAASNTNGAVVVNVDGIPRASLPGDPTNSYGFIRFRVKVQ